MILGDKLCDICGAPATRINRDVREMMPYKLEAGWWGKEVMFIGHPKFGCAKHQPEAEYEKWPPKNRLRAAP